jgi:uncharacterized RDD family membrane protein YckC
MQLEDYDYVPSVFESVAADSKPAAEAIRSQRLLNFVLDGLACLLLYYPVGYLVSAALYPFGADLFDVVQSPLQLWPAALALALLIAFTYYLVLETATQGRSLGKWITSTVATRDNGEPISVRDAAVRSLCRLIPFEPLSVLAGQPWHDSFSHTRVVRLSRAVSHEADTLPERSTNYDVKR